MDYKKNLCRFIFSMLNIISTLAIIYQNVLLSEDTIKKLLAENFMLSSQQQNLKNYCTFEKLFEAGRLLRIADKHKEALKLFTVRPFDWASNWESS